MPYRDPRVAAAYYEATKAKHAARGRAWAKANPEKVRDYKLRYKYGLSLERFNIILNAQQNRCCLCQMAFNNMLTPCVDHNHSTGEIRGILCRWCNLLVGYFEKGYRQPGVDRVNEYLGNKNGT